MEEAPCYHNTDASETRQSLEISDFDLQANGWRRLPSPAPASSPRSSDGWSNISEGSLEIWDGYEWWTDALDADPLVRVRNLIVYVGRFVLQTTSEIHDFVRIEAERRSRPHVSDDEEPSP
jgi:hypothetical protein